MLIDFCQLLLKIVLKIDEESSFGRMINFKYIKDQQGATEKIFIELKKYL